jgi:short-subunit dehydrogenase
VFAEALAAQRYHLIIVARRQERLQELADELTHRYSVQIEVLVADLSKEQDILRVEQHILQTNDLTMLINNAGFGTPGEFVDIPIQRTQEMLNVHILATTRLSWAALQGMQQRNQGAIINVSSIAAFLPFPTAVSYCATKVYLNTFSDALQRELKNTDITIQALCPGFTYTEFHDTPEYTGFDRARFPKWMWMSAEDVVQRSLRALSKKRVIIVPGKINTMLVWFMTNSMTAFLLKNITDIFRSKSLNSRIK